MRFLSIFISLIAFGLSSSGLSIPSTQSQHALASPAEGTIANVSTKFFAELEELARIVDISYCVGTTGISKPFQCASRCDDFPNFELVTTFNTGPLMSDSCGYVVLDHGNGVFDRKKNGRIIVAFRGTYSIANTIIDLSTVPQQYVPYPEQPGNSSTHNPENDEVHRRHRFWDRIPRPRFTQSSPDKDVGVPAGQSGAIIKNDEARKCQNCTVHSGFWTSWQNTRSVILPHIYLAITQNPNYDLHLVGHSLGGAVAALAGLEFEGLGWKPTITSFGEPRVGNAAFRDYIDTIFDLSGTDNNGNGERYRRVTHVDDPVPLLPLQEWGYRPHAGEVFISKADLSPEQSDVRFCRGDEDAECIAGAEVDEAWFGVSSHDMEDTGIDISEEIASAAVAKLSGGPVEAMKAGKRWGVPVPARYKMWQLFFAHRDYFWRLGLCVAGGDPWDWGRGQYDFSDTGEDDKEL